MVAISVSLFHFLSTAVFASWMFIDCDMGTMVCAQDYIMTPRIEPFSTI